MTGRWIRIADIGTADIPAARKIELAAAAIEEWAAAQALVTIHGEPRGAELYVLHGGRVRFDGDGEPVIWSPA